MKQTISSKVAKEFREFVQSKIENNDSFKGKNAKNSFVSNDLMDPSKSKILKHLKGSKYDTVKHKIEQAVLFFLSPIIKGIALSKKERMNKEILNGFVDTEKAERLFREFNFPFAVGVILLKHPWEFVDISGQCYHRNNYEPFAAVFESRE